MTKGRVRYYLTAFASILWHFLAAGIVYGILTFAATRVTGREMKITMVAGLSMLLSVLIVLAASTAEAAYLVGSGVSILFFIAWMLHYLKAEAAHRHA